MFVFIIFIFFKLFLVIKDCNVCKLTFLLAYCENSTPLWGTNVSSSCRPALFNSQVYLLSSIRRLKFVEIHLGSLRQTWPHEVKLDTLACLKEKPFKQKPFFVIMAPRVERLSILVSFSAPALRRIFKYKNSKPAMEFIMSTQFSSSLNLLHGEKRSGHERPQKSKNPAIFITA